MRRKQTLQAVAGVVLLAALPASAITVAGPDPNSSDYLVSAGSYSGVVQLSIVRPDLGGGAVVGCSGALLSNGVSILTAASCIANSSGIEEASAAYATFDLPGGDVTAQVSGFFVDPQYAGAAQDPSDIAILQLAAPAPPGVTTYQLYTGNAYGQIITVAGYGIGGTGATGYDGVTYPYGTLRAGQNQYDVNAGLDGLGFTFDSGSALGSSEVFISPGDTGGPSFIDGEIAGVHSFIAALPGSEGQLNSSFGEYAGDSSVAYNLSFLQSVAVVSAPEPKMQLLLGLALVALASLRPRRKNR
jgi:hypothetical protein